VADDLYKGDERIVGQVAGAVRDGEVEATGAVGGERPGPSVGPVTAPQLGPGTQLNRREAGE